MKIRMMSPREIAKMCPRPVDLLERLAALRVVPGLFARLRRMDTGGNDLAGGVYTVEHIDPLYFYEMIYEQYGGGTYEIRFHFYKEPLLLPNGRLETHIFNIAGEPKIRKQEPTFDEVIRALLKLLGVEEPSSPQT